MKVKVTMPKAHNAQNEPIPVGTILEIDGDVMPAFLVNKAEIVDEDVEKAEDDKSVSNAAKPVEPAKK